MRDYDVLGSCEPHPPKAWNPQLRRLRESIFGPTSVCMILNDLENLRPVQFSEDDHARPVTPGTEMDIEMAAEYTHALRCPVKTGWSLPPQRTRYDGNADSTE
jgi:hypothetical protein